jgi:hypothetical protein
MKKGTLIYWTIKNDLETNASQIDALGFGGFTPRNDYKSAMIKALRSYTKGNDKAYRAFNDNAKSVSYGVFVQEVFQADINMRKEVIVNVNKDTGEASFIIPPGVSFEQSAILIPYQHGRTTLDADQVRSIVLRYVKQNQGISMRPSGAIYFFDTKFEERIEKLRNLFKAFPSSTLFEIPIYGDPGTLQAIEEATSETIFGELESMIAEINKDYTTGVITKKKLEFKKEQTDKLMARIKEHEHNLRSKAEEVTRRAQSLNDALTTRLKVAEGSIIEDGDFSVMLRLL